jgi:hypothetical protein
MTFVSELKLILARKL